MLLCERAVAEAREPSEEIRLGIADVEQILHRYWRTSQVKAELERYKTSEEFKRKQEEVARLERELPGWRFPFFRERQTSEEVRKKRDELRQMAAKEVRRAREREKEAIEELLTDIRRSAESIGRENGHTVIFDSNMPQIVFIGTDLEKVDNVTGAVIDGLNSEKFTNYEPF